ncbi:MAG TPA: hypothetical protein PKY77_01325 [Phycisphaerae bacterium]|nr:hypothetical protein [Phycisphaerae bacterium]HRY67503.1 hypothetical protein [Phycisphaerae bacterium]HSA24890.1 hypothetical protein [Phycisphaerae bacterium]
MGTKTRRRFSDQIRELVTGSEYSCYTICKQTGIDKGAMSHFLAGHRGLSLESLDLLADFLDLQVVVCSEQRKAR